MWQQPQLVFSTRELEPCKKKTKQINFSNTYRTRQIT